MKLVAFFLLTLLFCCNALGQGGPRITDSTVLFVDSILSNGSDYRLIHYHKVSRMLGRKISLDTKDSILTDEFNDFSRLIFNNGKFSFNVPTVPLTHVIYLKHVGLILGLSKISASPYHILIYSTGGKLLHKFILSTLELKVHKDKIRELGKTYPGFRECLSQMTVIRDNDYYYLELTKCLINTIGRNTLVNMSELTTNHYFPTMGQASPPWDFEFVRFHNSFSDSDPLHDLITVGSVPFLLILNSEKGARINIPLVSNCNIFTELNEK